jgi:predicted transcriptional regulator
MPASEFGLFSGGRYGLTARPAHVVAIGCPVARDQGVVHADGWDLQQARVGIGLSCRL